MKILIIRFSSLGDIILLSCVFREIQEKFSKTNITFMTSSEFATVYSENPHISKIYSFNRKQSFTEIFRARKFLQVQKFDLIIDAHCSLRSRLLCFWKSGKRVTMSKRVWSRYSQIYWKRKPKKIVNQRDSYLQWMRKYKKIEDINNKSEFFLCERAKRNITIIFHSYLLQQSSLVIIAMGAKYFNKCWPAACWYSLVKKLKEARLQVVLMGTESDRKIVPNYKRVAAECSLDLTGKLSLQESAALLSKSLLLVCSDSAPLHLAEAVGTPVVAIFGPTTAGFGFAPFLENSHLLEVDLPCKPCSAHGKKKCSNKLEKECMKLVGVKDVWTAVENILKKK